MNLRTSAYRVMGGLALAFGLTVAPVAAQSISGTVLDEGGRPLRGIQVSFLDRVNAELIATATTDFVGAYDSGLVPPGSYRVRFQDTFGVGAPGFFVSEFFGAGGQDDFCQGAHVGVVVGSGTSGVSEELRFSEPVEVALFPGDIRGTVADAITGLPLGGITVIVFDAVDGDAVASTLTDSLGYYSLAFSNPMNRTVRVRFFDSSSTYFPQFAGAGADDLCLGTVVDLVSGEKLVVDALMQPIPGELVADLLDQVEDLGIPENVSTVLATPLVRAADLLTDGQAANDGAVCGQLAAFLTRVDVQQKKGQLSPPEAEALKSSANALMAALGCN